MIFGAAAGPIATGARAAKSRSHATVHATAVSSMLLNCYYSGRSSLNLSLNVVSIELLLSSFYNTLVHVQPSVSRSVVSVAPALPQQPTMQATAQAPAPYSLPPAAPTQLPPAAQPPPAVPPPSQGAPSNLMPPATAAPPPQFPHFNSSSSGPRPVYTPIASRPTLHSIFDHKDDALRRVCSACFLVHLYIRE